MPIFSCKLRVDRVLQSLNASGKVEQEQVQMIAVMENTPVKGDIRTWLPRADVKLFINDPTAFGRFVKGRELLVNFEDDSDPFPDVVI